MIVLFYRCFITLQVSYCFSRWTAFLLFIATVITMSHEVFLVYNFFETELCCVSLVLFYCCFISYRVSYSISHWTGFLLYYHSVDRDVDDDHGSKVGGWRESCPLLVAGRASSLQKHLISFYVRNGVLSMHHGWNFCVWEFCGRIISCSQPPKAEDQCPLPTPCLVLWTCMCDGWQFEGICPKKIVKIHTKFCAFSNSLDDSDSQTLLPIYAADAGV